MTEDKYCYRVDEQMGKEEKKIGYRFYTKNEEEAGPVVQIDSATCIGLKIGDMIYAESEYWRIKFINEETGIPHTNLKSIVSILLEKA